MLFVFLVSSQLNMQKKQIAFGQISTRIAKVTILRQGRIPFGGVLTEMIFYILNKS